MESKRIKILAIDDNPDNLVSIKAMLTDIFPEAMLLTASSGTEGLETAATETPNIILLDIIMPGMDGYSVCSKLKADKTLCDIPVIFITAITGDKESRIRALECGGDAFLSKPVDESELTAQIRAMLKINASNIRKHKEKEQLSVLVEEQTSELKRNYQATLKLLEDLKKENETRKKIERDLRESEGKYRAIFENVQDVFYQTSLTGSILEISPSINQLCEFTREELVGNPVSIIYLNSDDRDLLIQNLQLNNEVQDYEVELITKSGRTKTVSVNARLIRNKAGKPLYIDGALRDISDRKTAEEKARKIGLHYQAIIEKAPDGIVLIDQAGNFKFVSQSAKKMFGYSASEEPIGNPAQFTHPDDVQRVLAELMQLMQDPTYTPTIQYQYKDKQENWKWVESTFTNLLGDPNVESIVINFRDISDRKQAEDQLKKLQTAIENSEVSLVITDLTGAIEYANPYFTKLTGYSREEFTGENPRILNSGYHPKEVYETLWNTIKSGKTWEGEFYNRKKDGDFYWENAIISPVIDSKNEITHFVAIKTDITAVKKINEELIKAKEKAEESDRLKSAFLANMSHEIRTPMNGILGFAELLKTPGLSGETQQEYIRIIKKSGDRMLNLINDIIDISKIEAGLLDVNITQTNINDQLSFVYTFFKPQANKKGIQFVFENTLPASEAIINTDSEKLAAILTNLINNAIKYSDKGVVSFGYNLRPYGTNGMNKSLPELEFYVKDTGIGIPKERQKAIFDRFIQADITDTRALGGAGLGLAITKALIEILGGRIWVESNEGQGSAFYFTLPYQPVAEQKNEVEIFQVKETSHTQLKKLKVLIAEDDETSELLISIVIKKLSREIFRVKTGVDAVKVCRNNPDIDVILMDIQMPEMNGYEATRKIRKFNKDVVIIAQTAFGLAGDKETAITAGCTDYLAKPLEISELMRIIEKHFIR